MKPCSDDSFPHKPDPLLRSSKKNKHNCLVETLILSNLIFVYLLINNLFLHISLRLVIPSELVSIFILLNFMTYTKHKGKACGSFLQSHIISLFFWVTWLCSTVIKVQLLNQRVFKYKKNAVWFRVKNVWFGYVTFMLTFFFLY